MGTIIIDQSREETSLAIDGCRRIQKEVLVREETAVNYKMMGTYDWVLTIA